MEVPGLGRYIYHLGWGLGCRGLGIMKYIIWFRVQGLCKGRWVQVEFRILGLWVSVLKLKTENCKAVGSFGSSGFRA